MNKKVELDAQLRDAKIRFKLRYCPKCGALCEKKQGSFNKVSSKDRAPNDTSLERIYI